VHAATLACARAWERQAARAGARDARIAPAGGGRWIDPTLHALSPGAGALACCSRCLRRAGSRCGTRRSARTERECRGEGERGAGARRRGDAIREASDRAWTSRGLRAEARDGWQGLAALLASAERVTAAPAPGVLFAPGTRLCSRSRRFGRRSSGGNWVGRFSRPGARAGSARGRPADGAARDTRPHEPRRGLSRDALRAGGVPPGAWARCGTASPAHGEPAPVERIADTPHGASRLKTAGSAGACQRDGRVARGLEARTARYFDRRGDSAWPGSKPDPAIFRPRSTCSAVPADEALLVGDLSRGGRARPRAPGMAACLLLPPARPPARRIATVRSLRRLAEDLFRRDRFMMPRAALSRPIRVLVAKPASRPRTPAGQGGGRGAAYAGHGGGVHPTASDARK